MSWGPGSFQTSTYPEKALVVWSRLCYIAHACLLYRRYVIGHFQPFSGCGNRELAHLSSG